MKWTAPKLGPVTPADPSGGPPRTIILSGSFPPGARLTVAGVDYVHAKGGVFVLDEWTALQYFAIPMKIDNPSNQGFGRTRGGMLGRARVRREQRAKIKTISRGLMCPLLSRRYKTFEAYLGARRMRITVTRIAPRKLDEHDNLRTALKSVVDGITEGLGFARDDDPRIVWEYRQSRGRPHEKAVGVTFEIQKIERASIEGVENASIGGADSPDHGSGSGRGRRPRRAQVT